ncbi:LanC-like protein 2 [Mycena venus]|uniref:LanC-like protein 2 n=1 Tax=Mycena venus TaxID=2733690 RepID=A0A8H6Y0I7_9AGAR|nr:LanC-like protein 2 [Mycena venus]
MAVRAYCMPSYRSASKRDDIKTADSNSADLVAQVQKLSSKAQLQLVIQSIIHRGQSGAANYSQELAGKLPAPLLMWTWHGKRYLGAAHGVGKSTPVSFTYFCSVPPMSLIPDVLDPARTKKSKPSKSNAAQSNEVNYYLVRAVHLAQLAASHETLTANGEMGIPDYP